MTPVPPPQLAHAAPASARAPTRGRSAACRRAAGCAVGVVAITLAGACGHPAPVLPKPAAPAPSPVNTRAPSGTHALRSSAILSAPDGTLGPYVAYASKGAMALYSPGKETPRRWVVQPIGTAGSPASSPKNLTDAPDDVSFAVLRANDAADRFAAVWSGEGVDGNALFAAVMRADGTSLGVIEVVHGPQPCLWAEPVPVRDGFVVLWAEQSGSHARILARKVDAAGVLHGEPTVIDDTALAWQAEATGSGAAIVITRAVPGVAALGTVVLRLVDAQAQPAGDPQLISDRPTAQLDVDVARIRDSLLIAWTDRRDLDSRVWVAVTDLAGKIREPGHGATEPLGDQALIDIVSPADPSVDRALLVVDSLPHPSLDTYEASLVMLDAQGKVAGPTSRLSMSAETSSDAMFTGAPGGFLVLDRAPDCVDRSQARALVPWYVRVRQDQTLEAAWPLRWGGPDNIVASAWAPGCIGQTCFAVGADAKTPATVVTLQLDDRQPSCAAPWKATAGTASAVVSNRAIAAIDAPASGLSAVRVGESSLVAWITYFVEGPGATAKKPPPNAPGDPGKPAAAQIGLQELDEQGRPTGSPKLITVRGYSPGGVAMAVDPATKDSCVAWVARDNGDPQVFLTKVGADGTRKAQRMLTRARGDASDVAVLRVQGGWLVAWVDGRDGNGEVYAAKVDDALRPAGREVRVTQAAGDASEVSLFALGDEVLVAYGDTRDDPQRGLAAPYYRRLRLSNLAPVGEDRLIAKTRLHARSVRFASVGDDVLVSWLEVPIPGQPREAQEQPGLRVVRFDPVAGQPIVAPRLVAPEKGDATSYTLACGAGSCRGVMSVDTGNVAVLESFEVSARGQASTPQLIATLGAPAGTDVSPVLLGNELLYADATVSGEYRIRRAQLRFTR